MEDNLFSIESKKISDKRGYFLNLFRYQDNYYKKFWGSTWPPAHARAVRHGVVERLNEGLNY